MSNLIDESNYVNSNSFYLNNYTDLWKKLSKDNPALAFRFLYFEKMDDAFSFYRFNFGTEYPVEVKMYKEEAFKKCFRTYRELSIMGEERWIQEN